MEHHPPTTLFHSKRVRRCIIKARTTDFMSEAKTSNTDAININNIVRWAAVRHTKRALLSVGEFTEWYNGATFEPMNHVAVAQLTNLAKDRMVCHYRFSLHL